MIKNFIQPPKIIINENLELVKYYPNYNLTINWYSSPKLCKQVDGKEEAYSKERLKNMYKFLCKNGECYYIKYKDNGRWRLVGDISLYLGQIAIVIAQQWQNKHIGRECVKALLKRAKQVGYTEIKANIFSFNSQSKNMFQAVGFKQVSNEEYIYKL